MYDGHDKKLLPLDAGGNHKSKRKWLWAPVALLAMAVAGIGGYRYGSPIL